jgi:hypothetical protein
MGNTRDIQLTLEDIEEIVTIKNNILKDIGVLDEIQYAYNSEIAGMTLSEVKAFLCTKAEELNTLLLDTLKK